MKISTKGEYGIRAMLYIGMHSDAGPVTSHEIASHQGIPEPYLRQILALLSKDRLIQSNRGPQGGHVLGRPASEISLRQILVTLEGQITAVDQILALPCDIVAPCALGAVLNDDSIPKLRCKVVAGAANNQLAVEEPHGRALQERGILYAPDFVLNAGGLISVYNELMTSYNRERALRMTRGIYLNLMRVFEIARDEHIPTSAAAMRVAEERIQKVQGLRSQHWGRMIRQRRPPRA
jgi:Rrf2 family protein